MSAKLSRDIDLEIGNTAQGEKDGTGLLSLAWVYLWPVGTSLIHTNKDTQTHSLPREKHWLPEVSGDTHRCIHTQRATLISCLALLSSE